MNTKEKDRLIIVSITITILLFLVILGWIGLYSPDAFDHVKEMRLNDWGDFLGGTFGSVALFWLILGYMFQKQELHQNTEMLKLQAEEIKNTVDEYKQMVEINKKQLMLLTDPKVKTKILSRGPITINAGGNYFIEYQITIENLGGSIAKEVIVKITGIDILNEKNQTCLNSSISCGNFYAGQTNTIKNTYKIIGEDIDLLKKNNIAEIHYLTEHPFDGNNVPKKFGCNIEFC